MKATKIILRIILPMLVILCIFKQSGCKTPEELGYTPQFDSLYPPPPPPILYKPVNDTGYVIHGDPVSIPFIWSRVEGKECYFFQYCSDGKFEPGKFTEIEVQDSTITLDFYGGDRYWRVRAYSHEWSWYTEWSQVRYFWVIAHGY